MIPNAYAPEATAHRSPQPGRAAQRPRCAHE